MMWKVIPTASSENSVIVFFAAAGLPLFPSLIFCWVLCIVDKQHGRVAAFTLSIRMASSCADPSNPHVAGGGAEGGTEMRKKIV